MASLLPRLLAREQRAFLARDRSAWDEHLARVRAFLGDALASAPPGRPVLILGAGSGLEVPWGVAPRGTWGWDADPWSRLRTALRHGRWAPWVFADATGGLASLEALVRRCASDPTGRRRSREAAERRLEGLLDTCPAGAEALRRWIAGHHPGAILAANLLGQLGPVAEALLKAGLGWDPWEDPEAAPGLQAALDRWVLRAAGAVLGALADSGAALALVHDRGVVWGEAPGLRLAPAWAEPWTAQFEGVGVLEVSDPLPGLDLRSVVPGRPPIRAERWLWPLGPGQTHLMEALAFGPAVPGHNGAHRSAHPAPLGA